MFRSTRHSHTCSLGGVVAIALILLGAASCQAASPARERVLADIRAGAEKITGRRPAESRDAAQNCLPGGVPENSPLWESVLADYRGLPVQDCSPTHRVADAPNGRLTGRALLLLPTAAQAAEWIVSACEAQGPTEAALSKCAVKVLDHVKNQNNLQFVVAGVIHEPKEYGFDKKDWANAQCVKTKDKEVLYSFRDGITVKLQGLQDKDRTSFRSGPEEGCRPTQPSDLAVILTTEPKKVAAEGRVAGLRRDVYSACMSRSSPSDDDWRRLVRSSFVEAWAKKRYELMEVVAKAAWCLKASAPSTRPS